MRTSVRCLLQLINEEIWLSFEILTAVFHGIHFFKDMKVFLCKWFPLFHQSVITLCSGWSFPSQRNAHCSCHWELLTQQNGCLPRGPESSNVTVLYMGNVKVVVKLHFRMCIIKFYVQPLPDLCKGCDPWNSKQVEFYVGQNFPKFKSIFLPLAQEF